MRSKVWEVGIVLHGPDGCGKQDGEEREGQESDVVCKSRWLCPQMSPFAGIMTMRMVHFRMTLLGVPVVAELLLSPESWTMTWR